MRIMTLEEAIRDIHALNRELEAFEEKYELLSKDFYELYIRGKLRDEEIEEIDEYGQWAALYRMKLHRESLYEELVREKLQTALSVPEGSLVPTPIG
jgi:hypothetical protein